MSDDPMKAGTTKILAEYPDATDIQMKGHKHLFFSFMNHGERGSYTPKQHNVPDNLVWPQPEMGPMPVKHSPEFVAYLKNQEA